MKSPFENFKKTDWILIGFGIVILVMIVAVSLEINKFFSKTPVLEEKPIAFTVFFRGVTITDSESPFKPGEDTFITIRNVPYTKLKIINVKFDRRKVLLQTDKKGEYKLFDDVSVPYLYDFEVTLTDKAKITDDGAVVGGNKVKMGIPVILEGINYKFNGVVSNVQVILEDNTAAQNSPVTQPETPAVQKSTSENKTVTPADNQ